MVQIDEWMEKLKDKLIDIFHERLLFLGLQGSYRRNEANSDSDIDAVVILDYMKIEDLKLYRKIISTMPENNKACGFISGKKELENWPKHELFQFSHDTMTLYGNLKDVLPPIVRNDIVKSTKISASELYHGCCHTMIHNYKDVNAIKNFYKSAFFLLQAIYYLRNEKYISTKNELLPLLNKNEQRILEINMDWEKHIAEVATNSDLYLGLLINWCSDILTEAI